MTLARHSLDDLFRHRRIVFAALKIFIKQFNPEVGNFLPRALSDLFFNRPSPKLDIGDGARRRRSALLRFFVTQGLATLGYANDFNQVVRSNRRWCLAP